MAAKVRELRPATQIVILSGYDSFEYARTAIDYNIISYLLKPISSSEMSEELFEIRRRMDEKLGSVLSASDSNVQQQLRRLSVNEFLLPLMLGSNELRQDDRALLEQARSLGIVGQNCENARFCILVSKFKNGDGISCTDDKHTDFINNIISKYAHAESFVVYQRAVTLVVIDGEGELSNLLELPLREIVQTARRMLSQKCTIGVSREFSLLSNCSDAYFQAVTARRYTSDGAGEVRFINDQEHNEEFETEHAEKTVVQLEGGKRRIACRIYKRSLRKEHARKCKSAHVSDNRHGLPGRRFRVGRNGYNEAFGVEFNLFAYNVIQQRDRYEKRDDGFLRKGKIADLSVAQKGFGGSLRPRDADNR